MPTFHVLRAFVVLARHERYAAAAAELGVSQSTLSTQIAALERDLDLRLFEQLGGRTRLTGAGAELLDLVRGTVRLADEAVQAMAERAGADAATMAPVRLAADTTVGVYVLPGMLGAFRREHPQVRVELEIANRAAVIDRLTADDADLVVLGQPPDLQDMEAEPYLAHELVAFAAPGHPLVGQVRITLARLLSEPLVLREPGSGTRRTVESLCADARVSPRVALELGHNGAIKAAVAAGLGVGVISGIALTREVQLGRLALLDVDGFPIPRLWHIVRRPRHRLSTNATLVLEFLRAQRDGPQGTDGHTSDGSPSIP